MHDVIDPVWSAVVGHSELKRSAQLVAIESLECCGCGPVRPAGRSDGLDDRAEFLEETEVLEGRVVPDAEAALDSATKR
jgi:hypothetical protein